MSRTVEPPGDAPAPAAGIALRVDAEMTRALFRTAGFGLFSNLVLGVVLTVGAAAYSPVPFNLGWLAGLIVLSAARLGLAFAFHRRAPSPAGLPRWRGAFIVGVALGGAWWGLAAWMYFASSDLLPRLLLTLIVAGLNAGAARSLASVPLAYSIYILVTLTPLFVRFLTLPDRGFTTLAIITATYALFLLHTARLHCADLRQLHRLLFENEDLLVTLKAAKVRAESANLAKSSFLATVSHEIRTPMNGIVGLLQVLQNSPLPREEKAHVDLAIQSADTLLRLIDDILDLAKVESGKLEFEAVPFPLRAVVEQAGATVAGRARAKHLAFVVDFAPDLPATVIGDPLRLKQVLLNLLGNAVKFTDCGRVTLAVARSAGAPGETRVSFSVSDTGIGMDAATREKIFHAFTQADSSMSRRFGGSGLGLVIAQRLVDAMGGRIEVASAPGAGSTFTVELPFRLPEGAAPFAPVPAAPAPPRRLTGRVLVVEDDHINRRVAQLMLVQLGVTAAFAETGLEAVARCGGEAWDAVLMDCQLPGMDGFAATRKIRERFPREQLPIIALTANAMTTDRAACEAAGMNDFLAKPIRLSELRACLERWLPSDRPAA